MIAAAVTTISRNSPSDCRYDRDDLADAEDPQRDEQQHAAERGVAEFGASSAAPNASSAITTIAAATRPASCDRPPVSATTAVRGGLASTGNAPIRPDRMLPTPTPMKSRSTSGGSSGSDGKDRVVAAVCTMTTTAMMRLSEHQVVRLADRDHRDRERRQRRRDRAEQR